MDVYSGNSVTVPDLFDLPPYGLLDAITWLTPKDPHWRLGIQYDATCPFSDITITPCVSGAPATLTSKASTWNKLHRGSNSFTIYDEVNCTPDQNFWDSARDDALTALANSGPLKVEATFWSGATKDGVVIFPNLSATGQTLDSTNSIILQPSIVRITGTNALDIVEGLDRAEAQFNTCYPGVGWVHVPAGLIEAMCARYLVVERNGALYTWSGNRIIVGHGYPTNIGPGGIAPPAGTSWIYITSPVFGIRDTPRVVAPNVGAFDKNVNTLKMIAEQTFLLGWQCCAVGVQITTGGELAGLPGTPGPAT